MISTFGDLARALKGMPRNVPILVRMPEGRLLPIELVRPILLGSDGKEVSNGGRNAITLEVEPFP